MRIYNKLVRDNIPTIIEKDNKTSLVSILDDGVFLVELKKKLIEEATEASLTSSTKDLINELADIQEIIDKLREVYQIDQSEINAAQSYKAEKNGKFDKKLFLISVEDNHE